MDMDFAKPIPCILYGETEAVILASLPPAKDGLFMCQYTTVDGHPRKLIVHEKNIRRKE